MLSENGDVIVIDTTRRQTGRQTLPYGFSLIRRTLYLACVTDELNHSPSANQRRKGCSAPPSVSGVFYNRF